MSDLISRQAAIDFIDAGHLVNPNEPRWSDNDVVNFLKSRPSAQPERKKGFWIPQDFNKSNGMITTAVYYLPKCSVCGLTSFDTNFCPNCGADMRGEQDEYSN